MMRPVAPLLACFALLALAIAPGCYSMYGSPYGYGGYPSGYPAGTTYPGATPYPGPIQTLTPGQPYVPGGSYQSTIPQGTITTPGTTPTYQPPTNGLQPIPESGVPSTNSTPNGNRTTPDPYFNSTYNPPAAPAHNSIQPAGLSEPAPLNPPSSGMREVRSQTASTDATPWSELPVSAPAAATQVARQPLPITKEPAPAAESFELPRTSNPAAARPADPFFDAEPASRPTSAAPSRLPASAPAAAEPLWGHQQANKVQTVSMTPFAHDENFKWLRGVVSREPQDGTWSIVYNDAPDASDKWAGHLSLSPSPKLSQLNDGDVVEIQGQIDDVVRDQLGKPVYIISDVRKVYEFKK